MLRVYLSHQVHSIYLANFSGMLDNYNASVVCLLVVIQILKLAPFFNTCTALLCSLFVLCKHECFKTAPFHRFQQVIIKKKIMERAGH